MGSSTYFYSILTLFIINIVLFAIFDFKILFYTLIIFTILLALMLIFEDKLMEIKNVKKQKVVEDGGK